MGHWPELIERQLANALVKKCAERGHFSLESPEQLWVWQGRRRVNIKEALDLELPTVYGPPRARVIIGDPRKPNLGQTWHIETEPENLMELHLRTGTPPAGQPTAYVLQLSTVFDHEPQKQFIARIGEMGLVGMSMPLRGSDQAGGIKELAEVYLGLGRCYAGAVVTDLIRVIDHIDTHFTVEGEPIVLVLSGIGIPLGLAFAAIDQRISAVIVDFTSAPKSIIFPTAQPPFFMNQYLNLGPNPLLVLAQCCAPRLMKIIHLPENAQTPWLENEKSGVLAFTEQLKHLQTAYQTAGNPDRLEIIGPDQPKPDLRELIKKVLP